jgi:4-amino-4-deoxy-L-arabinose transferase-like glycosyltransferase
MAGVQEGLALGFGLLLIVVLGLLQAFGRLEILPDTKVEKKKADPLNLSGAPKWLRLLAGFNIRLLYLGLALLMAGACRVSVIGTLGAAAPWSGPLLFVLGLIAIIVARVKRRPFDGDLHQGFLVFAMATATIMSTLGSFGLWDCWETHYGEVARRQIEQDDWISLFWEDKWFYSKPILVFWLMNLGMALFDVNVLPDQVSSHAEWGLRFFVGVLAIGVLWAMYLLIAKRVSKRAGLFVAVTLGTMPLYGFMARQAITDLPFVGFMTLAVVLFLYGITAPKEAKAGSLSIPIWKGKKIVLNGFHAIIASYVLVGLPQFLYFATRSAAYRFGTLGRGDIKLRYAYNEYFRDKLSDIVPSLFGYKLGGALDISLDWLVLGLLMILPFLFILFTLRKEDRVSRLCFHGMYLCLSLSVMAKGLAGLALPVLGLFGFWFVLAPWSLILKPWKFILWHLEKMRRLDLLRGFPMFLLVGIPWYAAMIMRHADAFIQRFFIHDHIKRLSVGVHGEHGTFQYYIEQFAYAAFPWCVFLPFAMLAWVGRPKPSGPETPEERSLRLIRLFAATLFLVTFALFAMMVTKFHHYALPMLVPAAILIGLFLDDAWSGRIGNTKAIALVALVILTLVARDLVFDPTTKAQGVLDGHTQLVGLFIYKYSRPYPEGEAYNFSTPLLVFTLLFAAGFLGWAFSKRRRIAMVFTILSALAFSHFTNQHYMVKLTPHWTQKHLIEEYYKRRNSEDERFVAFQMNWKGENFYTGNRVVVYVSTTNRQFEQWIDKHRGERHFFITEHSRYHRMSERAKAASGPIEPFPDLCNKYRAGVADKL